VIAHTFTLSLARSIVSKYFPLFSFCHLPLIELVLGVDLDVIGGPGGGGEGPGEDLLCHALHAEA
jgi:hypothetical protein